MRAREPEAVIFDMDGVIIDSQAAANRALVEAAARHGVRLAVSELEDLVGATPQQFWQYVKWRYALPEAIDYYAESYDENSEIAGYDETLLSPGLDALLADLRSAGISLALATSASRNGWMSRCVVKTRRATNLRRTCSWRPLARSRCHPPTAWWSKTHRRALPLHAPPA